MLIQHGRGDGTYRLLLFRSASAVDAVSGSDVILEAGVGQRTVRLDQLAVGVLRVIH